MKILKLALGKSVTGYPVLIAPSGEKVCVASSYQWSDYLLWLQTYAEKLEDEVDFLEKRIEHGA